MVFKPVKRRRVITREAGHKSQGSAAPTQQDAQALLASANSASERMAGQHVAFMAVCVYVLVIVFGTTDLDLLMGRGVKLPVVNVDVPIVGFYTFAPYLVVLVHFNLLLQLQLLSRELFAFDAVAPYEEGIGGLRDRLHTFPYTYYLVGRPNLLVRRLVGLMVSITLMLLPFATLIALQLWFLAYQSEAVTWLQRIAIWIDVVLVVIIWPLILDPRDDWYAYWRGILNAHIPRRSVWIAFGLLLLGQMLFSFSAAGEEKFLFGQTSAFTIGCVLLLLSPPTLIMLCGWKRLSPVRKSYFSLLFLLVAGIIFVSVGLQKVETVKATIFAVPWLVVPLAMFWHPQAPRGSLALLLTIYMGALLPLALHVDGERTERILLWAQGMPHGSTVMSGLLGEVRWLNLNEQVLLAKPASPEMLTFVRAGEGEKALQQTEPINIKNRNLRHATMYETILIGATLREAHLLGAYLKKAHLQGASLWNASLQDAVFREADLQGATLNDADLQSADLGSAHLQGADLRKAALQGADLGGAHLLGADLNEAHLQGANLSKAHLLGANLAKADLRGADLSGADLQGADLSEAQLQGADLSRANLYAARIDNWNAALVDAREVTWAPLEKNVLDEMMADSKKWVKGKTYFKPVLTSLEKAATLEDVSRMEKHSCLATPGTSLNCEYDPQQAEELDKFKQQLLSSLGELACESEHIVWGIAQQSRIKENASSREGLKIELEKRLGDKKCKGLQALSAKKKEKLGWSSSASK